MGIDDKVSGLHLSPSLSLPRVYMVCFPASRETCPTLISGMRK